MLPRAERLTRRRDFAAVYARKRSWANPLLVLYVLRRSAHEGDATAAAEPVETRRLGFSVSKKVGKAHDRNGVKRRLRAICREDGGSWRRGFDAVFVARAGAAAASYEELRAAVAHLIGRAELALPAQNRGGEDESATSSVPRGATRGEDGVSEPVSGNGEAAEKAANRG